MARDGRGRVSETQDLEGQREEIQAMKKSIVVALTDRELQDLYRVLIDRDAEGALCFLDQYLGRKVRQALEGG